MTLRDESHILLARVHRSPGRLYRLELQIARLVCLSVHTWEDAWCWHAHFGHVNFTSLKKKGLEGLVHGLLVLEVCLTRKHR
jgi:hypothetical protein